LRAKIASLTAEIRELDKALPKLATRICKLDMEAAAAATTHEQLLARLKSASAAGASQPNAADVKALEAMAAGVAALEVESARLSAVSSRLEAEVAGLQKQILEFGGEKVRRAKARTERASEALEAVIKAATKAKADMKAAEKVVEKTTQAIAAAQKESAAALQAQDRLAAERKVIEEEAIAAISAAQAAEGAVAARATEVSALGPEFAVLERDIRGVKSAEEELSARLDEMKAAHAVRALSPCVRVWTLHRQS
jgi:chromosome segregation ATPase